MLTTSDIHRRFKIAGLPKEKEYSGLPFGRQIEYHQQIAAFKATAKITWISTKRRTTKAAIAEFLKLYKPEQYWLEYKENANYKDDSLQVWYV